MKGLCVGKEEAASLKPLLPFALLAALAILPALLLPWVWSQPGAVRLEAGCPLFSEPEVGAPLLGKLASGGEFVPIETKRRHLPAPAARWEPLMRYVDFHKIDLGDGASTAWASPGLKMDEGMVLNLKKLPQRRFLALAASALAGLLASLALLKRPASDARERQCWERGACLLFAAVFLRQLLTGVFLGFSEAMEIRPTDEIQYFAIAKAIGTLDLHGQWSYTAGFPLVMLPFTWLWKPESLFDMLESFSVFNSFCLSAGSLAVLFLIVKALSGSELKAFATAATLAALPFVYYPFEGWSGNCFRAFFAPPSFDAASYRAYYLFNWTGFNAYSDTASALLALLCVLICLRLRKGAVPAAAVSALFGFACMVRVNNVMFAPLIAYLLMKANKEDLKSPKLAWKALGAALGGFLLGFGLQLAINAADFGSPFKFPYLLHPNAAAKGFLVSSLPFGINYLTQCNMLYMAAGLAGAAFIRDSFKRVVFVLWALPLTVFFCGYPVVEANPVRFLLPAYGALLGAFVCCDAWPPLTGWRGVAAVAIAAGNFALVIPPFQHLRDKFKLQPFGLPLCDTTANVLIGLAIAVPLASAITAVLAFRNDRKPLLFLFTLLALFCAGSGWLFFAGALALIVWAASSFAMEAWREIFSSWLKREAKAPRQDGDIRPTP